MPTEAGVGQKMRTKELNIWVGNTTKQIASSNTIVNPNIFY